MDKGGAGAENKYFGSATLVFSILTVPVPYRYRMKEKSQLFPSFRFLTMGRKL